VCSSDLAESIRRLIAVDPKSEAWLRAFAKAHKEEAYLIDHVLKFRAIVLEVFEALVEAGAPADVEAAGKEEPILAA